TYPLRVRSLVGAIPLIAVEVLEGDLIGSLPGFRKRLDWFLQYRRDLSSQIAYMEKNRNGDKLLLAIPSRDRLLRVLRYLLDELEFLSPYGLRAVSRVHRDEPYIFRADGQEYRVDYVPGESNTGLFGGNSNWRGPIWFPLNFLIIEALERYHHFYGDDLRVECPTGSGTMMTLLEVSREIAGRLTRMFLPDTDGRRPAHGEEARYTTDPHWKDLVLFYEYFHGDDGRGIGASHQTGWTALVVRLLEKLALDRAEATHKVVASGRAAENAESARSSKRSSGKRRPTRVRVSS
ncbi:MAG: hypothetical protein R3344_09740, partial [Acidobacteriota bacterium]|nr:hypothetical protein [Acidobacteriota bacterium]